MQESLAPLRLKPIQTDLQEHLCPDGWRLDDEEIHSAGRIRATSSWQITCATSMTFANEHGDVATASLLENWIDEAERRAWLWLIFASPSLEKF